MTSRTVSLSPWVWVSYLPLARYLDVHRPLDLNMSNFPRFLRLMVAMHSVAPVKKQIGSPPSPSNQSRSLASSLASLLPSIPPTECRCRPSESLSYVRLQDGLSDSNSALLKFILCTAARETCLKPRTDMDTSLRKTCQWLPLFVGLS